LRAFFQLRVFGFVLIAGFLAGTFVVRADTKPVAQPGYRLVPITSGGKTAYIQVKDSPNLYGNVRDEASGENTPEHVNFNATSAMAHKSYLSEIGASPAAGAYQDKMQSTFLTKSYFPDHGAAADKVVPGLDAAVPMTSAAAYEHPATGFDRRFDAARSADEQDRTFATTAASESGQTAVLGGNAVKKFAYADSGKTYEGPDADAVKRDLNRMNNGLESMKDLPDRPLTVDEVRALINHGVKPDLEEKPPEASKPLNDPGYMPDPAPAPERNPGPVDLKDQNDEVPAPGTIAHPGVVAPENSEALPQ
jgi:hypothetical protein